MLPALSNLNNEGEHKLAEAQRGSDVPIYSIKLDELKAPIFLSICNGR